MMRLFDGSEKKQEEVGRREISSETSVKRRRFLNGHDKARECIDMVSHEGEMEDGKKTIWGLLRVVPAHPLSR